MSAYDHQMLSGDDMCLFLHIFRKGRDSYGQTTTQNIKRKQNMQK